MYRINYTNYQSVVCRPSLWKPLHSGIRVTDSPEFRRRGLGRASFTAVRARELPALQQMAEEESSVAPVVAEANGEAASIKKEAAVKKERVKPLPRPDRAAFDEQVGALQAQARAAPQ